MALARTVLPVPGTSSMSRWPRHIRATSASRTSLCLPTITRSTLATTFSPVSWIFVVIVLPRGVTGDRVADGGRDWQMERRGDGRVGGPEVSKIVRRGRRTGSHRDVRDQPGCVFARRRGHVAPPRSPIILIGRPGWRNRPPSRRRPNWRDREVIIAASRLAVVGPPFIPGIVTTRRPTASSGSRSRSSRRGRARPPRTRQPPRLRTARPGRARSPQARGAR